MSIWFVEYFEAGSSAAYMSQTIIGAEAKDAAVVQFLRSGGDEVLKITPWRAACLRWLRTQASGRERGSRPLKPSGR